MYIYCILWIISLLKETSITKQLGTYCMKWPEVCSTWPLEHWNPKGVKKWPTFYGTWMFTILPLHSVLSQINTFTPSHIVSLVLILTWSHHLCLNLPFHLIIIQYNLWDSVYEFQMILWHKFKSSRGLWITVWKSQC